MNDEDNNSEYEQNNKDYEDYYYIGEGDYEQIVGAVDNIPQS